MSGPTVRSSPSSCAASSPRGVLDLFRTARLEALDDSPQARRFRVASPEDTILAKLEWFRAGGEASYRQWTDVVGVLRAVSDALDVAYLHRWGQSIGVEDLLEKALRDAGGP